MHFYNSKAHRIAFDNVIEIALNLHRIDFKLITLTFVVSNYASPIFDLQVCLALTLVLVCKPTPASNAPGVVGSENC